MDEDEVDLDRHFPLSAIFNSTEYRRLTRPMGDELAEQIDRMQSVFKEVRIPVQAFRTDQKERVAIIFERINRQGVPLDTLQLLSAWTWSEDFQLQNQFEELIDELNDYGFSDISNDISLLLRCTAAILTGSSRPESLVSVNGADVRAKFDTVLNGIRGSLDFIQTEFSIPSIENLPYQNILVPMAVFFAVPDGTEITLTDDQRRALSVWFWRSAYSKRYSSGVLRHLDTDIAEVAKLKAGNASALGGFAVSVGPDYFLQNRFLANSVNTKTFVATLAQSGPRNFVSGTPVDLEKKLQKYNRKEFHHLMPKAFLTSSGQTEPSENVLANFCFISRADNREVGGVAPSQYKAKMAQNVDEVLASHLCPNALFDDKFQEFVNLRAERLAVKARELCAIDG